MKKQSEFEKFERTVTRLLKVPHSIKSERKTMTKKKTRAQLPKHPPKKTGKAGIKPLNADADFDKPTTKSVQGELLNPPAKQPTPAIQHGKMAAHFVKFVPDRTKNRDRVVFLDFSLELEEAHSGKLPREVEDAWKDLKNGSIKRIDPNGIGSQNLSVSLVPDGSVDLEVVAAVPKAVISRITSKGKGKERKVTRLQMRFLTSFTKDVEQFCSNAYDETTWLQMKESQRSFADDEEEEATD
jgi:hypothetical protein